MVNRKYVPKLRFKGFTDEWGRRKLGGICSEIGDGLHSAPEYDEDGDYFFINGNNLVNGEIHVDAEETKRVSKETFEKNNCHLDENTVLLSINGTIGNLAYYRGENVMLGKSAAFLKARDVEKSFLYSLLQTSSVLNDFMHSLTGTTIKNLGLTAIKNTSIYIPNIDEQNIIGQFFTDLDNLIALHQRKCDKLKEYKKGCLQKMFPRGDADVPEVRFPGFTGAWERRKLGELIEDDTIIEQSDGNHGELYPRSEEFTEEGIPYIAASSISSDGESVDFNLTKYLPIERALQFRKGVAKNGDVLLAHNATVGPSIILSMKYEFAILSTSLTLYRLDIDKMSPVFFLQAIRSELFQSQLTVFMKQTTRNQVPILTQRNLEIAYPKNIPEQKKIADFLSNLDNLIALQKRECEKYKELKKGLLQQMFV